MHTLDSARTVNHLDCYVNSRPVLRKIPAWEQRTKPEIEELNKRAGLLFELIPQQYIFAFDGKDNCCALPGFLILAHVDLATRAVTEVLIEPMEIWGRDVTDLGVDYIHKRLQESNEHSAPFGPDVRNTAFWVVGAFDKSVPLHMVCCSSEKVHAGYLEDRPGLCRFNDDLMRASLQNLQVEFSAQALLDQVGNPADAPLQRHFAALHDLLAFSRTSWSFFDTKVSAVESVRRREQKTAQQRFEKAQDEATRSRRAAVAAKNVQLQALEQRMKKQGQDALLAQQALRRDIAFLQEQLSMAKEKGQALPEEPVPPVRVEDPEPQQVAEDDDPTFWRETVEHQAAVIRQLRLALQYVPATGEDSAGPQKPRKLTELSDWAAENADRVVVLTRAIHSAKKSNFEDQEFVFKALDMLATTYRDVKLGLIDRMAYAKACESLGLDMGGSIAEAPGEDYFFQWRGRRTFLDQHLGRGTSRDPRYCFRAYFTWDAEEAKVIIGWLPSHLPTRTT